MTAPDLIFLDAEAVARRMGLPDGPAFLRRRLDLEDKRGFPVAMPHWKRPLKWRADQVDAWLASQGTPRDTAPDIDPALISSGHVRILAEARRG
ncbi:MAG: hypothetical protein PHX82_04930 [Paracoccaceae bacterium]|nr:hypothetical protein [Paracoccaceae bacterium]